MHALALREGRKRIEVVVVGKNGPNERKAWVWDYTERRHGLHATRVPIRYFSSPFPSSLSQPVVA